MPVLIQSVEPASYAARAGIRPGDTLLAVDRHPIADVLDYRFYVTSRRITLELLRAGKPLPRAFQRANTTTSGWSLKRI